MFSKRLCLVQEQTLQKDFISQSLINKLRNFSSIILGVVFCNGNKVEVNKKLSLAMKFGIDIDDFSGSYIFFKSEVKKKFFVDNPFYLVYDFCEFLLNIYDGELNQLDKSSLIQTLNSILISENSAYRLTQEGIFIPITSETELQSLNEVIESSYQSVNKHITDAINLFKNKDYRNVAKECISAVESMAKIIAPSSENKTLGDALNTLKRLGYKLPTPLIEGFKKLHGFTNDSGGIRHSLLEDESFVVDFDLAKYMLVSCSAFINLLISVYEPRKA